MVAPSLSQEQSPMSALDDREEKGKCTFNHFSFHGSVMLSAKDPTHDEVKPSGPLITHS